MNTPNPYLRPLVIGAVWHIAAALNMLSRHPAHWTTYPPRNFVVLVISWIVTALLLRAAASRIAILRSWLAVGVGTVFGSLLVLSLMLLIVKQVLPLPSPPEFKSTDEMMGYFAAEATKWVKQDRHIDLDYSVDSIKIIEEELARISKEVNPTNPQPGTLGTATGYGAYIGEVLRHRDGGSWAVDHPTAGERSYPLTTRSNLVLFPVGWCWRRLINGEEDNVYLKALNLTDSSLLTNASGMK